MSLIDQDRQTIMQVIDELPDESLDELRVFVTYLRYKQQYPGSAWVRTLYDLFEPVREGAAHMSEDEINRLIDEELEAVRRERDT